jgi:hypothetical protein
MAEKSAKPLMCQLAIKNAHVTTFKDEGGFCYRLMFFPVFYTEPKDGKRWKSRSGAYSAGKRLLPEVVAELRRKWKRHLKGGP